MYGKQTETAIAAISRLAEVYDPSGPRLSSADIAESRGLQRPMLGKIMAVLSQAGIVTGTTGPGGGYRLARTPADISLFDVYTLFERENRDRSCPFGGGICGEGDDCPLHAQLVRIKNQMFDVLHETTFDVFASMHRGNNGTPPTLKQSPPKSKPDDS